MCSLLQRGQRLGERIALLLVKVNPQARHWEGVILKLPLSDLCTCSRCTYTSFWGMRMVLERSCAVHSPVRNSSMIAFRIVMCFLVRLRMQVTLFGKCYFQIETISIPFMLSVFILVRPLRLNCSSNSG